MPGRALDLLTLVLIAALHGILWYAVDDGLNDSILSKRGCAGKEGTYVILSLEKRAMHLQTLFWKNGTTTWSYWGTRGRGESIGFLVPASPTIKSECARTHGCQTKRIGRRTRDQLPVFRVLHGSPFQQYRHRRPAVGLGVLECHCNIPFCVQRGIPSHWLST
jgi:hypothetical protein